MIRPPSRFLLPIAGLLVLGALAWGYPKPSAYPVSWELKFEHSVPKRIVVTPKGGKTAEAYWYITYTVSNLGKEEQRFLPVFQMLSDEDKVIRSDTGIPTEVLATIRLREKAPHLLSATDVGGILRVGEDQAKDGVAIWREPKAEMGQFTIFVTGLSGEAIILKDDSGNVVEKAGKDGKKEPVILFKTLQVRYHMAGDEKFPGNDAVELVDRSWVMR